MICADCGHEHDAVVETCSACGKDPLLDGRYRLSSVIGQGAFGTTWRGERASDGHVVCLKELLYQRLASFEPEEQFRREAAVLRQLDLPGVRRLQVRVGSIAGHQGHSENPPAPHLASFGSVPVSSNT